MWISEGARMKATSPRARRRREWREEEREWVREMREGKEREEEQAEVEMRAGWDGRGEGRREKAYSVMERGRVVEGRGTGGLRL